MSKILFYYWIIYVYVSLAELLLFAPLLFSAFLHHTLCHLFGWTILRWPLYLIADFYIFPTECPWFHRDNEVPYFVEDFPASLLLQLVQKAGTATKEGDKISCNAARAIGNLLRYLPARSFESKEMLSAIEVAVKGLVRNMNVGAMKVCVATGPLKKKNT